MPLHYRWRPAMIAVLFACGVAASLSPAALGWGADVHRSVTTLALEALPPDAPAWLRDPQTHRRAASLSNQPDRWRGWRSDTLKHANDPEHYLDAEQLSAYGLTLETIPPLRREYLKKLVIARHEHPGRVPPHDPNQDPARAQEWPGFVLHAVSEEYARLQAAFCQVQVLERMDDPNRRVELEEARAIATYHIGALAHFVADIAQPLHTTEHFDGWVGANPAGYRWREKFHAYIDEGFAARHGIGKAEIRAAGGFEGSRGQGAEGSRGQGAEGARGAGVEGGGDDPWGLVREYFARSHALVVPLYTMERDGALDSDTGRALILQQLGDATVVLRKLIWQAYATSAPSDKQVESWLKYDGTPKASTPASQPGGSAGQPATSMLFR